jgi:OmpA-OmpF porin, OOP family
MNQTRKTRSMMLAAVLAAGLTPCIAQAEAEAGAWYVGAGIGQANSDFDTDSIAFISGTPIDADGTSTAFKIFAGYQVGKYFGIEFGYIDMGEITATAPGPDTYTAALSGFDAFVVGIWPISNEFSLFGKFGFIAWNSDLSVSLAGLGSAKDSFSDTDLAYGFGAQYNFSKNFGLRAEYEAFDIDPVAAGAGNTYVVTLSATYKF